MLLPDTCVPPSTYRISHATTHNPQGRKMKTVSLTLLLGVVLGAVQASGPSFSPTAFFNRFSGWGEEEYEYEEEEEGPGLGGLALKALVGAGVAAVGGAGVSFARRAIKAKQQQQVSAPKRRSSMAGRSSTSAGSSNTPSFVESGIKGGKSDAKVPRGATTTAPPPPTAADSAGGEEEEAEEPEEVFEVEPVQELDESTLTAAQKEHPYAKLLGPKLVKYDPKDRKLVEVATADVLDGKVTSLFFHAHQVWTEGRKEGREESRKEMVLFRLHTHSQYSNAYSSSSSSFPLKKNKNKNKTHTHTHTGGTNARKNEGRQGPPWPQRSLCRAAKEGEQL